MLSDIVVLGRSYNKLSRSAALVLLSALTGTQNKNPKNNNDAAEQNNPDTSSAQLGADSG
jgi:hypothetical protein